jgi:shikimate kinase
LRIALLPVVIKRGLCGPVAIFAIAMNDTRHVLLIGSMCAGKTTVGRVLAGRMQRPFVDLDRVIEQRVGPITPFFQREGEEAFRREESTVLDELLAGVPSVIATGGGTPCMGNNLQRMKAAGTVVWLDVPMEALMPRIERAGGDRPLLFGLKGEELRERVEELLEAREPFYAEAHMIVQAGAAPEVVAERITRVLNPDQAK